MFGLSTREKHADHWLATYDEIDAALVARGWPKTSPWWRAELERFIRSGKRRWVIRAGRRAGKSSTLCRVSICQGIAGGWSVPPGDVAVVSFTSLDRDEAGSRLRTIDEALTALGIPHERTTDEISIASKRLVYRVTTCSIRSVGFTSIMLVGDEMARWESRDTAANPAREVMASQRPTMATMPTGIEVDCSSPWGEDDYHHELCEEGDSRHQVYSFAPSWVANPTLTEELTHELEPDQRVWSREYSAVPGGTLSAALDPEDVKSAFELIQEPPDLKVGKAVGAIDASSLRGDAFAWLLAAESSVGLLVVGIDAIEGSALRRHSMEDVVRKIANECASDGIKHVYGDQRESASLQSLFLQQSIQFTSYAWTDASKDAAFQLLRRLLRERKIHIENHAQLRKQMLECKAHLMPSGRIKYATNGLDYLSALITLLHAVIADELNIETFGVRTMQYAFAGNDGMEWGRGKGF